MKLSDTRISTAGIYRCCLASIGEITNEVAIGDKHKCKHCQRVFKLTRQLPNDIWKPETP